MNDNIDHKGYHIILQAYLSKIKNLIIISSLQCSISVVEIICRELSQFKYFNNRIFY